MSMYFGVSTEEFADFIHFVVVAGILICVLGVTSVSVFFQVLLNVINIKLNLIYLFRRKKLRRKKDFYP